RFFKAAREAGVRPIVGAELSLRDGTVLPLLVATRTGYQNLSRLITRGQLAAAKGETRFDLEAIAAFNEGLIALTGDAFEGLFASAPNARWRPRLAELRKIFPNPGQLYVELNHHQRRGDTRRLQALADLAA